ncbi:MAG TPA: helix-turn-helix domain-containing protein [Acidimicrobiales bacterium]|nr:helix-turn-helix domain-containing protein [Acidimicrobiales bacterium]
MARTPPDAKPPQAVRQDDDRRPERLALSVEEASDLLGISKWLGYEMVAQGILPALRLGRRLVVPLAALERMLEEVAQTPSGLGSRRAVD